MALPTSDNTVNVTRFGSTLSRLWTTIKTKFGTKADLNSPAFTGTPTAPTAADGTNTTQIATTAFVKQAVIDGMATADAMQYKGTITLGTTSPGAYTAAASKGHTYKVVKNGTDERGYVDGVAVEAGDMIICNADSTAAATSSNYSTIATKWDFIQGNLDGVVIGPASAVDGQIPVFDGATGKLIKNSGKTLTVTSTSVSDGTTTFNKYTHPTTSGNKHIPSGGSSGQFLGWDSDGTAKWVSNPNTDIKVKATAKTDNVNYKVLATASSSPTSGNATEAVYDTDITLNPSTNTISANISGNAATATTAQNYDTSTGTIKTALDGKVDFGLSNNSSSIGNDAPAADCISYWGSDNIPDNHIKMVYNQPGYESTLIFSKRSTYGSIVKYGYEDKYIYILRNQNGTWKSSSWEKISAGYADSAGTATTAQNYDTNTGTIKTALAGKSDTSHVHNTDANDVTNNATGSDLSEVTDTTEFVTTNIGGYSSADKKLYRRPFGTKVWPWIKSKLGISSAVGSSTLPVYFDSNGQAKAIGSDLQVVKGSSDSEANVRAMYDGNNKIYLCSSSTTNGIAMYNGGTFKWMCSSDRNGNATFNGLARGIYPILINGVSNKNYAVFAKVVLDTSVAANTKASLRFRLTVLGTNPDSQNMAVSDLTLKLLPHESDWWSLCERIHRADTDSTSQQPDSDVGRCIYWKSGATAYFGVYTGSWNAKVGVEVVSVWGAGSSFTYDVADYSGSVTSGNELPVYNRTSAWTDNNSGEGASNKPVYARKDGRLVAVSVTAGSANLPIYMNAGVPTEMERSIILYDNRSGVTYKNPFVSVRIDDTHFCNMEAWNNSGTINCGIYAKNGSGSAEFICYKDSNGVNWFNGTAMSLYDHNNGGVVKLEVGRIGTDANTLYII